jgi:hypothetical protein
MSAANRTAVARSGDDSLQVGSGCLVLYRAVWTLSATLQTLVKAEAAALESEIRAVNAERVDGQDLPSESACHPRTANAYVRTNFSFAQSPHTD